MPFFNTMPIRATVQCATVVRWEQEACNGNVHTIDRVLIPATNSITEWLAANRSFSIMTQLLKVTTRFRPDAPFHALELNLMNGSI